MTAIRERHESISMLVSSFDAEFTKKATGRITFICNDGDLVRKCILKAIETGEGQKCILSTTGTDEAGDVVSKMHFQWSIKVKAPA